MRLDFVVRLDGQADDLRLEGDGASWLVSRSGKSEPLSVARLADGRVSILLSDGRQLCGRVGGPCDGEVEVVTRDGPRLVRLADPLTDRLSRSGSAERDLREEEIRTRMPGRVLEVRVVDGDAVEAGHVLVVLEAMKMQNEIRSSRSGVVASCRVRPGEAVESNALLLVVAPLQGADR